MAYEDENEDNPFQAGVWIKPPWYDTLSAALNSGPGGMAASSETANLANMNRLTAPAVDWQQAVATAQNSGLGSFYDMAGVNANAPVTPPLSYFAPPVPGMASGSVTTAVAPARSAYNPFIPFKLDGGGGSNPFGGFGFSDFSTIDTIEPNYTWGWGTGSLGGFGGGYDNWSWGNIGNVGLVGGGIGGGGGGATQPTTPGLTFVGPAPESGVGPQMDPRLRELVDRELARDLEHINKQRAAAGQPELSPNINSEEWDAYKKAAVDRAISIWESTNAPAPSTTAPNQPGISIGGIGIPGTGGLTGGQGGINILPLPIGLGGAAALTGIGLLGSRIFGTGGGGGGGTGGGSQPDPNAGSAAVIGGLGGGTTSGTPSVPPDSEPQTSIYVPPPPGQAEEKPPVTNAVVPVRETTPTTSIFTPISPGMAALNPPVTTIDPTNPPGTPLTPVTPTTTPTNPTIMPIVPTRRNYFGEGSEVLGAMNALQPGITNLYANAAGAYSQADLNALNAILGRYGQTAGDLTSLANQQTIASNRALREANLQDVASMASGAREAMTAANPNIFGPLDEYTAAALAGMQRDNTAVARAGQLTDEEIRNAQQAAREAWSARGLVNSPGAVAEEVLNREAYRQQREAIARANAQQSMGNVLSAIGANTANIFNPFSTILGPQYGMQTQNVGTNNALFGQTAGLSSGQYGNAFAQNAFYPWNTYGTDVFGTNVNADIAAQIATANNAAALEAAKMGASGMQSQANAQLAQNFLNTLFNVGKSNKWW